MPFRALVVTVVSVLERAILNSVALRANTMAPIGGLALAICGRTQLHCLAASESWKRLASVAKWNIKE